MVKKLNISYDSDLIESISADFDLRTPNKKALRELIFTLDGDYDTNIMQVLNLATGVGKTYLMAAFIEYLRRQGIGNVVIVTPGKVVQSKTVQNFVPGNDKYIEGAQVPPDIVTPQDYSAWRSRINGRTIGDNGIRDDILLEPVFIDRNPRFKDVSYKFPVTIVKLEQPPIDLSEISDRSIEEAAKKVTSTGDVLYRKEIVAALGKKLRVVDTESAEVDSIHIEYSDAANALSQLVMYMQLVPSTKENICYIEKYLVPKFMKSVTFETWTIKSLDSAKIQLQDIVKAYIESVQRSTKEIPVIQPKEIKFDRYTLTLGDKIYDPIESKNQFVRGRFYSGWFKSLFEAESFDSYRGEYVLAKLLNTSPHIVWWHRLHMHHGAYIYYNAKDRYFPDFVARDDLGVYWIIEGKDQRGRDDAKVQAKRKAAEALVRRLITVEEYVNQKWGYLIAYEDDIAKADSWDDLKALAQPVCNIV